MYFVIAMGSVLQRRPEFFYDDAAGYTLSFRLGDVVRVKRVN